MKSKQLALILGVIALLALISGGWLTFYRPIAAKPLQEKSFADDLVGNRDVQITPHPDVTFLMAGDIMLSRNVAGAIAKAKDPALPYKAVAALLHSTNFNVANLESPLSGASGFNPTGSLVFNAPPDDVANLGDYFQIVNLANNHALDQGPAGATFTKNFLAQHGVGSFGTGQNLDQAWQPVIQAANGVKVAFLGASYAAYNDGGARASNYVARTDQTDRLKAAIADARQLADAVIVTMHAGTEYTAAPNPQQIAFAHAAIDDGADAVIGAHPHWVQTIERYRGKYIFYSLGNFIFDQEWSAQTKQGLAVKFTVRDKKLFTAELVPLAIDNFCCPHQTDDPAIVQQILNRTGATSTLLSFPSGPP